MVIKKLVDKSNCSRVWSEHLKTLDCWDKFFFFGCPFVVSLILCLLNVSIDKDFYSNLGTAYSVVSAILLSFLAIVYDMILNEKEKVREKQNKTKKELLKEVVPNVGFTILVSLVGLLFVLVFFCNIEIQNIFGFDVTKIVNFLNYWGRILLKFTHIYIAVLFLLSFLMVLKRLHGLLLNETKNETN